MKKTIVLISGKLQSGKNTFADILSEELKLSNINCTFDMFAGPLKDQCKEIFKRLTDTLNSYGYLYAIPDLITRDESWYEKKNPITRILLQTYGTDIIRNTISKNWWVDKFVERFTKSESNICIITDVRYENEISRLEESNEFNVLKIRVERTNVVRNSLDEHESEKALDDYSSWNFKIMNDGSLDDLKIKAQEVIKNVTLFETLQNETLK